MISGTVIELSAILVDKIIFRKPSGGFVNTHCCSSKVMVECNGYVAHLKKISSLKDQFYSGCHYYSRKFLSHIFFKIQYKSITENFEKSKATK